MMRELRLLAFFVVGLVLGGGAVSAFAGVADYGRSMRLNAPPSSGARFTGAPIYDWADAPSGWGKMNDINKINIGGKAFDVTGGRLFSPQTLAKGAVSFVRFGGPAWLGFMLAGLVWDEVTQRWLNPGAGPEELPAANIGEMSACGYLGAVGRSAYDLGGDHWRVALGSDSSWYAQGYETVRYCIGEPFSSGADGWPQLLRKRGNGTVPDTQATPATDAELEDAIYVELVARGMGSDLARRLIEAGYNPPVEGIEIDGPSSIPGGSTTTTTSGPAGQTTTTTNTTHNVTYNTNTTNNTSTVTVTTTNVSTTVAPDGTTTETTTESPAEDGETPPPEEKPFCELYPTASACQELGETPDEEMDSENVDVAWAQQGGAAGSCPAPIQATILGSTYAIEWTPICATASGIRPIVIGLAWLSAAVWLFLMARARA